MPVRFVPLRMREANAFVEQHHRHNRDVVSHMFSIGPVAGEELVGIATVSRPVARMLDTGRVVEVRRVCVKPGHPNACSKLYARARRICQLMGFEKVITYTLATDSGSSLRAMRALPERRIRPHKGWARSARPGAWQDTYGVEKLRWDLNGGPSEDDGRAGRTE